MQLYVNDLSLHSQFTNSVDFKQALKEILDCRSCAETYSRRFIVYRTIMGRNVMLQQDFRTAVQDIRDLGIKRAVMSWLTKNGPFADDELVRDPAEIYSYNDEWVTDEVLGEVAARALRGDHVVTVSFSPSDYMKEELCITWLQDDDSSKVCDIENYWEQVTLRQRMENAQAPIKSWGDLVNRAKTRFTHLTFLDLFGKDLIGEPFSQLIASNAMELLFVLNQLKANINEHGRFTIEADNLKRLYFEGHHPKFTDASETEKNDPTFRSRMIFKAPDGSSLECFWHGKINHLFFRLHFSSPITREAPLYIAYLGQKLTKQ